MSAGELYRRTRTAAGTKWRHTGRHRFIDRSHGSDRALLILGGHRPYLWPHTLSRLGRHTPADIDVCLVTAGVDHPELEELASQHAWSYLSTTNGNVSLAQNLAIDRLPRAQEIFKIDEDIFISEGFFSSLRDGLHQAQARSEFAVGLCSPVLNVNGFSYVDFLRVKQVEHDYTTRFGELRRAAGGVPAHFDGAAAVWLWQHTLPIDETAAEFGSRPFGWSVVPHRLSIGAVLFERAFWKEMRGFTRGFGAPGLGRDEGYISTVCTQTSQVPVVIHNVFAGHFAFGPQEPAMREAFGARLSEFDS
jgi:hypothetical protein